MEEPETAPTSQVAQRVHVAPLARAVPRARVPERVMGALTPPGQLPDGPVEARPEMAVDPHLRPGPASRPGPRPRALPQRRSLRPYRPLVARVRGAGSLTARAALPIEPRLERPLARVQVA